MEKLRELIEIVRSILPKAHNTLARAMVLSGIALILGPPIVEKLIFIILNKTINTQLTELDQLYGLVLVFWGSIYHIVMTKLSEITRALESGKKHEIRKTLINECRAYLDNRGFNRGEFAETVIYSRLKPHLSERLQNKIEKDPNHVTVSTGTARGSGVDNFKSDVLDELVELEKKWRLI